MGTFVVSITVDTLGANAECVAIKNALDAVSDDFGRNGGLVTSGNAAADIGTPHVTSAGWTFTP